MPLAERLTEKELKEKNIAFFGEFSRWPGYYSQRTPESLATASGARLQEKVDDQLDYLVIGAKRGKGKADAIRRANKINDKQAGSIAVMDEEEFLFLTHPMLKNACFAFAGGFIYCPEHVIDGQSYSVVEQVGATVCSTIDDSTNFFVLGDKRAKGKAAAQKKIDQRIAKGQDITILNEEQFLDLISSQLNPKALDFQSLIVKLRDVAVGTRLDNALTMLRHDKFRLFSDLTPERLTGIVSSQSGYSDAYSCMIQEDGTYNCVDDDMNGCMSSQGHTICKHLLVLILGMVHTGELSATTAYQWVKSGSSMRPTSETDVLAQTLLRYKGVQVGEVDWRPTETIPEDYYAY